MIALALLLAAADVPQVAAGTTFTCTPVAVYDGDGPLWCAEGPRLRLAGIAAREIDNTCRSNQPCPNVSGVASRDHLVSLVGIKIGVGPKGHILVRGQPLTCLSIGNGVGVRTAAWCRNSKGDINQLMVDHGYALRWQQYWKKKPQY